MTDDQGWRIEIKKYPRPTSLGRGGKKWMTTKHHAMHSVATIASYQGLGLSCADTVSQVQTFTGVSKDIMCAGNDTVFTFIDNIIEELAGIFPSEYFHIGGDEAPLDAWKNCLVCQALKEKQHITTDQQLLSYFFWIAKNKIVNLTYKNKFHEKKHTNTADDQFNTRPCLPQCQRADMESDLVG